MPMRYSNKLYKDERGSELRKTSVLRNTIALLVILNWIGLYHVTQGGKFEDKYMSDEKRLIKRLLEQYGLTGKYGRPVVNRSVTLNVEYGLGLIQILDLDERDQVLTSNVWCRYKWTDALLRWKPQDYGDVSIVRVPPTSIWKPDIVLYNYADERLAEHRHALAVVQSTGEVMWIPMAIFKSTCSIDITYFPFDKQHCELKFGSWTYDGFQLDLNFLYDKEEIELNDYMSSNEWEILDAPAIKNNKKYPCCVEPYPDLTFHLRVKRKLTLYNFTLLLPCALLSTLTMVLFWLPPESVAKMLLGMSIFIAFFLLLRLLASSTPPASTRIPLIGMYFCLNMVMITLSTVLSVLVIQLYFRGDRKNRVPKWARTVFLDFAARIIGLGHDCMKGATAVLDAEEREERRRMMASRQYGAILDGSCGGTTGGEESEFNNGGDISPIIELKPSLRQNLRDIRKAFDFHMSRLKKKDKMSRITMEWRLIALVLDRIFFFCYMMMIIVSLVTVFPQAE